MSYPAWKRTCKQAILKFENAAWNARLHADDDFKRFRQLHTYIQPSLLWKCAIDCRSQYHSSIVSKLWTHNYEISSTDILCHRCGLMYTDKYVHAVVVCEEMALLREDFDAHVRHTFGNQVYNELRSGSDERKLQTLIGKRILALLNLNIQKHFLRMAISYVSTCMLSV